ncbi:MAG: hypothetical protein WA188_05785 [Terriglobales bacterium]
MTCSLCKHAAKKFGYYGKRRIQRYRCVSCGITFAGPHSRTLGKHYLSPETVCQILQLMLEGMSIRAICRFTGVDKNTITSVLNTAGEKARHVFDGRIRNVRPAFVQMDELWGFVHTKEQHLGDDDPQEWGDAYVWLAIDADTKLILSYYVGTRTTASAFEFVRDLSTRTVGRFQITTDSLRGYVGAIAEHYGENIDFAQLQKVYARLQGGADWYGSGKVLAAVPRVRTGDLISLF